MEGHREGVFVFGESLEAAYDCLMRWYRAETSVKDKKKGASLHEAPRCFAFLSAVSQCFRR